MTTNSKYGYSTRWASKFAFYLPKIRTNYGKFSIRYFGPNAWNDIEDSEKFLTFWQFKRKLKKSYFKQYKAT